MNIETFIRPDVVNMKEYTPILPLEVLSRRLGRPPTEIVKLDANENPYGPAPLVRNRLAEFPFYHIYPDPEQTELREALSAYVSVPAEHLLVGHGADELIDLIARLFLLPGNTVVDCPPTFGMYAFDASLVGAEVIRVWRRDDFSVDVDGIVRQVTTHSDGYRPPKLLFLTSPNNPDGSLLSPNDLRRLLRLPLVVVVDEAYTEFSGVESFAQWVPTHPNLIVLRTFSKWAGIAGLRLGYGIFPLPIIRHLWKIKQPYNANVAAAVAGLASLEALEERRQTIAAIVAERERLQQELARFDFLYPYPSRANFVLCRVVGRDARELKLALEREGVLVRYFAKPRLKDCLRISVGRPEDTDALLEALERLKNT